MLLFSFPFHENMVVPMVHIKKRSTQNSLKCRKLEKLKKNLTAEDPNKRFESRNDQKILGYDLIPLKPSNLVGDFSAKHLVTL